MKIESYERFSEYINSNEQLNVYLIRGDNSYYTKKALEEIRKKCIGNVESEFSYQCFDGKTISVEELLLSCEMPSMMCEHKCICVMDLNFEKITEADVESLCTVLSDMPDFSTLIFYSISDDLDFKKSKSKRIHDLIIKHGVDVNFTTKSSKGQAVNFAINKAKEKGCTISTTNAKILCEKAFNDFSIISSEIEKITNYKCGAEITLDDIEKIFSIYLNSTVYELSKYVLANNLEMSLKKLEDMKQQKEDPIAIISVLSLSFIDIYRAAQAKKFNKNVKDVMNDFQYGGNVEFRVENAFKDCRRFNLDFIKLCIEYMIKTDLELKTTSSDQYWLLEQLIFDIFVARERMGI